MGKNPKQELILTAVCKNGHVKYDNIHDEVRFANNFDGQKVFVTLRPASDLTAKQRMFAYLFGPLLDAVANALDDLGTANCSKQDYYEALKSKFARVPYYNPILGKEQSKTIDFSSDAVTSSQLCDFINKVVLFCEQDIGIEAPNADEWKIQARLGASKRSFKQP